MDLKSTQKPLERFLSMLNDANVKGVEDDIVKAFQTLVTTYLQVKSDTDAERAARSKEFAAALTDLHTRVEASLTGTRETIVSKLQADAQYDKQARTRDMADALQRMQAVIKAQLALVENGETPDDTRLIALIRPLIPDPIPGSPDTADDIVNKLLLLPAGEKLPISAIEGLPEALARSADQHRVNGPGPGMASQAGRDIFSDIDLSASLNGVTTTFQIHAVYNIIAVSLSSTPNALRKGVDYTYTPTTITFVGLDAATQLAAGQTCVLTVVNA